MGTYSLAKRAGIRRCQDLRRLMQRHKLDHVAVARLLGVALYKDPRRVNTYQSPTVARWLSNPSSARWVAVPPQKLELLRLKLKYSADR